MSHDEVGYWSEIKLDIIKKYAKAYSTIISKQPKFYHMYIDAFAGSGTHIRKKTNDLILGSPLNALNITPPFREFHLIDIETNKIDALKEAIGSRDDVTIYPGDCNIILLNQVFPKVDYKDYKRALCLLDPYGLHLNWNVMKTAGTMGSIELFLNFPILDMNRNVLWRDPQKVKQSQIERMNAFWGDESWREIAYKPSIQTNLFGLQEKEKVTNDNIAEAFRQRLIKVAGFKYVLKPMPMRDKGKTLYYLFFAAQKPVADKIVRDIFNKYKDRGKQ